MNFSNPASTSTFQLPLAFQFSIPAAQPEARWNFWIDAENTLHAFPTNIVEGLDARSNGALYQCAPAIAGPKRDPCEEYLMGSASTVSSRPDDNSNNNSYASTPSINEDTNITTGFAKALAPTGAADETVDSNRTLDGGRLDRLSMLDHSIKLADTNTIISFMETPNQIDAHVNMHEMSDTNPGHCNKLSAHRNASVWHFIEKSDQRRQARSRKLLFEFLLQNICNVRDHMVGTLEGQNRDELCMPLVSPARGPMIGSPSWTSIARDVSPRAP